MVLGVCGLGCFWLFPLCGLQDSNRLTGGMKGFCLPAAQHSHVWKIKQCWERPHIVLGTGLQLAPQTSRQPTQKGTK